MFQLIPRIWHRCTIKWWRTTNHSFSYPRFHRHCKEGIFIRGIQFYYQLLIGFILKMIKLCSLFCSIFLNHSVILSAFSINVLLKFCISCCCFHHVLLYLFSQVVFSQIDKTDYRVTHKIFIIIFLYKKAICLTVYIHSIEGVYISCFH